MHDVSVHPPYWNSHFLGVPTCSILMELCNLNTRKSKTACVKIHKLLQCRVTCIDCDDIVYWKGDFLTQHTLHTVLLKIGVKKSKLFSSWHELFVHTNDDFCYKFCIWGLFLLCCLFGPYKCTYLYNVYLSEAPWPYNLLKTVRIE